MRGWARKFSVTAALVGVGLFFVGPATVASAQGYVPPPPPPTPTPPAPSGVIATCLIGTGGVTCTATVDGLFISITFAPGTFTSTTTQGLFSAGTAPAGVSGTVVGTFDFSIVQSGVKFAGTFSPPASITVSSGAIAVGDELLEGSTVIGTATTAGSVSSTFDSDPNFAVVSPTAVAVPTSVTVPSATLPLTGKPFLGEGLLAIGLFALGGLGFWRWRRASRTNI